MTVSSNNTAELTIDQLIAQALRAVGMMAPEQPASGLQFEARAAVGRTQLQLILNELQARQQILRQVENYTLTVSSGDGTEANPIELPGDTIDVIGDATWKPADQDIESPIFQMDHAEWNGAADKTNTSVPTRMWVERKATVKIYLLQPPGDDQDGATLRVRRQKLLANMVQAGASTPDLDRSWQPFLMWKLAAFFAGGTLPQQATFALAQARSAYDAAFSATVSRIPQRFRYRGW